MISRKLKDIAEWINGEGRGTHFSEVVVSGVSTDTRTIKEGNLYIPLVGENYNGHEFVEQAMEKGAVGALWQKNQPHPPNDVPLIFVDDTLKALQELAK